MAVLLNGTLVPTITRTQLIVDLVDQRECTSLPIDRTVLTAIINLVMSPMSMNQVNDAVNLMHAGAVKQHRLSAILTCDLYVEYTRQYTILG